MCFPRCFKTNIIPVIQLKGVISSSNNSEISFKKINKLLKMALLYRPKIIAVLINSPGGSPVQSELIYKRLIQLSKDNDIPIYAFIEDVAASGGYYIACGAEKIFGLSNSIVGSIGVISTGFGFTELIKKIGVERRVYTQGENKNILDPFSIEKEEDVKIIKSIQEDIYGNFKDVVIKSRGSRLINTDIFTGQVWSGLKAKELGLIDEIGDIYSVMKGEFGEDIKLKFIQERQSLFGSLKESIGIESIIDYIFMRIENKLRYSGLLT